MYKKIIWILISVMIIFVSSMSVFSNSSGSSGFFYAEDENCDGNQNQDGDDSQGNPTDSNQNTDPAESPQNDDSEGASEDNVTPTSSIATTPSSTTISETTDDPNMSDSNIVMAEKDGVLPKTGEEKNTVGIIIGSSLILLSAGYVIFRKKQIQ